MEADINKKRFELISKNLIKYIISREFHSKINYQKLITKIFGDKTILTYDEILNKYSRDKTQVRINFIKRVILVDYALKVFKRKGEINTQFIWRLIFDSLKFFKKDNSLAGIGSQGFVSIELYRFEKERNRKILRLHIWNETFDNKFNQKELGKYNVHSHLYNAQSHIIVGNILNNRYKVKKTENKTNKSLYSIKWKSTTNKNGYTQRSSYLEEEHKDIELQKLSSEKNFLINNMIFLSTNFIVPNL